MIERDGSPADRTRKRILQQPNVVVVDVDILENFLEHDVHHLTGLENLVHSCRPLSVEDVEFAVRRLPVDVLRDRLVNRQRQD